MYPCFSPSELINGETYNFSAHKIPVFYEKKNVEWVYWGYSTDYEDQEWNNLQPNYYDWLYNSSSKHRSIINRKTLFINGKGAKGDFKNLDAGEKAELGAFIFNVNNSEIVKKWGLNLTKVGGFCYEVIPEKNGKKIDAHYVNIKNIRKSKPEYDDEGRELPSTYYYTRNWKSRKPTENQDFTVFEEWDFTDNFDKSKRYLVYYSEDEENIYPIPEYTAAVPYIAADYEIGNFTYNNTKNGFSAGYLINFFNGDLEDDQKAEIVESIKAKLLFPTPLPPVSKINTSLFANVSYKSMLTKSLYVLYLFILRLSKPLLRSSPDRRSGSYVGYENVRLRHGHLPCEYLPYVHPPCGHFHYLMCEHS